MTTIDLSLRSFTPGTTGWSAGDLDDPEFERMWCEGKYEIVEGVLAKMAPAYFDGGYGLANLLVLCHNHVRQHRLGGFFATEVDIIIDEFRVAVVDMIYLTGADKRRQEMAAARSGRGDLNKTRILVPPTLIIESVSPGHEQHDRRTKSRWYAEFRVPNYWILDAFEKSLICWVLDGDAYRQDAAGKGSDQIRTGLFPDLLISLSEIWNQ